MPARSYKYRIYPNAEQKRQLAVEFGHSRFVWNWALDMRVKAYRRRKETLRSIAIDKILTQLKHTNRYDWLRDGTADCYTQKLRDQDLAFRNFFGLRAKFPKFKRKTDRQAVRYKLDQRRIHQVFVAGKLLRLPKLGPVRTRWTRLPKEAPKMATVSLDPSGRYFVSVSVDEEIPLLPACSSVVGVDFGIKDIAVTSGGWKSGAPKVYRKNQRALAKAQRILSRRNKGSKRWERQRKKVANIHARISDSRTDFLHKISHKLISENQAISIEDLNVSGMKRNRCLSKAFSDTGMRELRRQIEYKAEWYGRHVEVIDRWTPTSKTCSGCGHRLDELNLSVREWTCPKCGSTHDRDINAAINILHTARSAGINARGGWTNPEAAVDQSQPLMASNEARIHHE